MTTSTLQPAEIAILTVVDRAGRPMRIGEIRTRLSDPIPHRTLHRRISSLVERGYLESKGKGRATAYELVSGRIREAPRPRITKEEQYTDYITISDESREIQEYVRRPRAGRDPVGYSRDFLSSYQPNASWYLGESLRAHLRKVGDTGESPRPAGSYGRQILSRLLIDLSWASSRLEGNTYSRLDTQRLIEFGQFAVGKDAQEAQMILNHKAAIEMLVDHAEIVGFNTYTVLNLHSLLSENLMDNPDSCGRLRTGIVEIGGSVYLPVAIPQVIEEAFHEILSKADEIADPFEQSFFVLTHLPYLQPFEDVNKRTSRLAANISLVKQNLCPLTFLDIPKEAYVEAILGVYEMNRIDLLRDVFVWAYERSSREYSQIRKSLVEPDPIRLRYREPLHEVVGQAVRERVSDARRFITRYAERIDDIDRKRFMEAALEDIRGLHMGNLHRYRITQSEFEEWQKLKGVD
jgi:Fic family protein